MIDQTNLPMLLPPWRADRSKLTAASVLGVGKTKIFEMIKQRRVAVVRPSDGRVMIETASLIAFMQGRRTPAVTEQAE